MLKVLMKDKLKPRAVVDGVELFDIPGWEGKYAVSRFGSVYSLERMVRHGNGSMRIQTGRWLKTPKDGRGYPACKLYSPNECVTVHRIMGVVFLGVCSREQQIDHKNGNKEDNRLANLRVVSNQQNQWNRRKITGEVPYKGVTKHGPSWRASATKDGKAYRVGAFESPEDAAIAYNKLAKNLYGAFAATNQLT